MQDSLPVRLFGKARWARLRPLLLGLLALMAAGLGPSLPSAATGDEPNPPKIPDIAGDYKRLRLMTPERVFVDPELAMLCRGASAKEVEEARKKSGPHAHTAIRIYMNDLAADAFRGAKKPYPVGSIVVKEKSRQGYMPEGRDREMKATADGVGGMVKRPRGFDPEHGDWEYFYFEVPTKIESGKIASCVSCHAGASDRDHVFGGWAVAGRKGAGAAPGPQDESR